MIRRLRGGRAFGLVYPLVTNADGTKLGKTEQGTIWLDAKKTSSYRFYQFWLNQPDAATIPYLKYFTWLGREEIAGLEQGVAEHPERREAQRTLASEVTRMVHGDRALVDAQKASEALFGGSIEGLSAATIEDIFAEAPGSELPKIALEGAGKAVVDLLSEAGAGQIQGRSAAAHHVGRRVRQQCAR